MEELTDDFASPKTRPPKLVLTFDDGYADNLKEALPVCRKHNLPMLVYVTSGFIERTHVAWWHFLEQLILSEPHISIPSRQLDFSTKTSIQKRACFDQLANLLRNASAHHQRQFLKEMCTSYGYQPLDYAKDLFLNHSELKTLAAHKLVSIGVHGVSHAASAFLSESDFQSEFRQCRDFLQDETSKKIKHSAFPFGSSDTVSPENVHWTQSLGFDSATTTEHGCVVGKTKNLFALPRIPVFPEDTKYSIACKLSGVTTVVNALRRKNLMSRSAVSPETLLSD
ncbi:MAG: polysaccharide deacetylase family protein [Thiotrichales bacterium]